MNIQEIEVVLFDLDGTIYYGSKIIDGANETISFFRRNGKKIYFTTNNSTKTRKQIFERLRNMGVDCALEEVMTSGYLAAVNAKKHSIKDVYIFGSENLITEFKEAGVSINQNEDAKNLLIGYDPNFTYDGLTKALQVALHADCIMACNKEKVYPGENGRLMPGCGAMTAAIEWCANRTCDYIIGKPNTLMIELLLDIEKTDADKFLVIGDTFESDIVMAKSSGSKSILISDKQNSDVITVNSISEVPNCFRDN